MSTIPLAFHPIAEIFPLLEGPQFHELVTDIRQHGLREAIVLHSDGRILDGRNRYRACLAAGVEPAFRTWDGQGSLIAFVVSLNLHRRHLSESQRGLVAARLREQYQAEAKERQREHGGTAPGRSAAVPANLPEVTGPGEWRERAAEDFGVSARTVQSAATVVEQGAPALVQAVERGEVAVSTAATVASALPPEEQVELVARGEAEILAAAREIRAEHRSKRHPDDYYPTPAWLVQALLRHLEAIGAGSTGELLRSLRPSYRVVLDPGAGKGALAAGVEAAALARGERNAGITAVEVNADFCRELQEQHPTWRVEQGDFFAWAAHERADFAGRRDWHLIVTNPPFGRWQEWVDACLGLVDKNGLLCVLAFANVLGAQSRAAWWREHRPEMVLFSPRRPQYREDSSNGDPRDTCWIVWRGPGSSSRTALDWLDTELTSDASGAGETGDGGEEATA
jgi:hypothetical protein